MRKDEKVGEIKSRVGYTRCERNWDLPQGRERLAVLHAKTSLNGDFVFSCILWNKQNKTSIIKHLTFMCIYIISYCEGWQNQCWLQTQYEREMLKMETPYTSIVQTFSALSMWCYSIDQLSLQALSLQQNPREYLWWLLWIIGLCTNQKYHAT